MPGGATRARARQVATLRGLAHDHFTSERVGRFLEVLRGEELNPLASDLVRVASRDYARACRIPSRLVQELAAAASRAKDTWQRARQTNDFNLFAPHLERIVDLNIEKAEALGYDVCCYDALLDEFEPGMRTAEVARLFAALKVELVPMVRAITACESPPYAFLHEQYERAGQWEFGMHVLRAVGYDFMRGRQDESAHPFSTTFSISDVRITTRLSEHNVASALFSTLHEAGHALYEQGMDLDLENTPLAEGTSLGMHESQSRLWENQVGRSRPFWVHFYPILQEHFPSQLGAIDLDTFHRAINRVAPSFIRVEADELTYNLHIMLRFELEQLMVERKASVGDLPALWDARMEEYLGVCPPTAAQGILQDIHWALGAIGYFPTYALGNLMSAQVYACARRDLPQLDRCMADGDFADLRTWLRLHIHRHGRRRSAAAILAGLDGGALAAEPWLALMREKYGSLYGIQL